MDVMNPQTTGQQMQLYTGQSTRRPCTMDAVNVQTFATYRPPNCHKLEYKNV